MEGFFVNKGSSHSVEGASIGGLTLLAKNGSLEIMRYSLIQNATVWLVPAGNDSDIEFLFVQEGELEVTLDDDLITFGPGESFYIKGLQNEVFVKVKQESTILYISTSPIFDAEIGFQTELTKLVEQVNAKDNYTFRHSRNVMRYSVRLYEVLQEYCESEVGGDLVIASLFHDVGKCYTPDEILKKKDRLTPEEYRRMIRHPIDSAKLLSHYFNDRIISWARSHHERLDGTGYPFGLKADDISFEARILAVADVFDAMTTNRGYNRVKSFEEAADELVSLPDAFDTRITTALRELVREGKVTSTEDET